MSTTRIYLEWKTYMFMQKPKEKSVLTETNVIQN